MQVGLIVPRESLESLGGAARSWRSFFEVLEARPEFEPIMISETATELDCPSVLEDYARFAEIDVAGLDVVIATKYPAWMVDHPHVVIWMLHPLRGLYDLYPPGASTQDHGSTDQTLMSSVREGNAEALRELAQIVRQDPGRPEYAFPGPLVRHVVTALDHRAYRRADRVLTISRTVASRTGYFPVGLHPRAVLHPQSLDVATAEVEPGRLFTASRFDPMKRIDLIIEAVKQSDLVTELRIAGSGPDEERLRRLASGDHRITFLGVVSDAELAVEYAKASLVPFVPRDEDFGLVTLEAWAQSRPVITVSDSGGVAEMVVDGETGLVASPTGASLSEAFDVLLASPATADTLGELGEKRAADVTWDRVVAKLFRDRRRPRSTFTLRQNVGPRVVVVSSEEVGPGRHGGQIRSSELWGSLRADVRFVSLGSPTAREEETRISANAIESVVPRTVDHLMAERQLSDEVGLQVIDVVADQLQHLTPKFSRLLGRELADADVAVLSQPYLSATALSMLPSTALVVYDAHNVEASLKETLLSHSASARSLFDDVVGLEARAVEAADLVVTVCERDRDDLEDRYGQLASSIVIPNGARVHAIAFVPPGRRTALQARLLDGLGAKEASALALFLGSWHPPNIAGAHQLLDEVEAGFGHGNGHSNLHLMLAGGHARALDPARLPRRVHSLAVLGHARKKTLLSSCVVALNPVTTGSGSNLKLVEYLAAGCSVVSTEFGSRGFDDLRDAITIGEPGALVAAATEVARDPRGNDRRARLGRVLVERAYDWSRLSMSLEAELNLQ